MCVCVCTSVRVCACVGVGVGGGGGVLKVMFDSCNCHLKREEAGWYAIHLLNWPSMLTGSLAARKAATDVGLCMTDTPSSYPSLCRFFMILLRIRASGPWLTGAASVTSCIGEKERNCS